MSDSSNKRGHHLDRRRFLKLGAGAVAAVPVAALVGGRIAYASDLPKLDEADPSAVALGYKHAAADVDTVAAAVASDLIGQGAGDIIARLGRAD